MIKVQGFTSSPARRANLFYRLSVWLGRTNRRLTCGRLSELNDHLLADIGIARDEVRHVEYMRRASWSEADIHPRETVG